MKYGSYWVTNSAQAPIAHNYRPIPEEARVVIIGASLAGLFTAYWLQCSGIKNIVILDKGPHIGYDDFGRSLGVSTPPCVRTYSKLTMRAFARNAELIQKFITKNKIDCSSRNTGSFLTSISKDEASFVEHIRQKMLDGGFSHTCIDAESIRQVIPSSALHQSLFIPGELAIDPFSFMNIVAFKLEASSNTRIYTNVYVSDAVKDGGSYQVQLEGGDTIRAEYVIHANNHTSNLGYIKGYREQLVATDELPSSIAETFPPMPVFMEGGHTCYRIHRDRLLCSFVDTSVDLLQYGMSSHRNLNEQMIRNAVQTTSVLFPTTTISTPDNIWSRMIYTTDDELPIVGPIEKNANESVICGFGTRDLGLSFLASCLLAKRIAEGNVTAVAKSLEPSRFVNHGDMNNE